MTEKPHLLLDWIFDIPNQKLTCKINDDLMYEAHEGGLKGFTKIYKGKTSHVSLKEWGDEKFWISENYGDLVGYFQPDYNRVLWHPVHKRPDPSPNGVGPDGRYIDHMQRMQILLEGEDCATIGLGNSNTLYSTPDQGKTIFKRVPTRDIHYAEVDSDPTSWWSEHSQACAMQPRTSGVRLSSYTEMQEDGIPVKDIEKCKNSEWSKPPHPELQKFYIYPS